MELSIVALCAAQSGTVDPASAQQKGQPAKARFGVPPVNVFPKSPVLPSAAESNEGGPPGQAPKDNAKGGEFIFAPIPFSNQAFSFGLLPVLIYNLPNGIDKSTPTSSVFLGAMLAQRSSWGIGGGGRFYLSQDRYRLTAHGVHGSVSYEIFGVGTEGGSEGRAILIDQGGDMAFTEFLVRLGKKIYLGPRFSYRKLTAALNTESSAIASPPGLDQQDLGSLFNTHAVGFKLTQDTRSDVFYPTSGHQAEFIADFYSATQTQELLSLNRDLHYQNYQFSYNHYLPLAPKSVLAFRGMGCNVEGNAPFYELCQFGTFSDIRGYQPGRYRDHTMFATQAELRQILSRRFGFVVFGGMGEVAPDWGSFSTDNLLPAGGTGVRFNLSRKERINLRADIAYGKTGWSWNFMVGEAF